jgi:hypothetical protein
MGYQQSVLDTDREDHILEALLRRLLAMLCVLVQR